MTFVPRLNGNTYEALRYFSSPIKSWVWWIFPDGILILLFTHWDWWLKKRVIMNQNSRNKPEILWMEKYYVTLFWNHDHLEIGPILTFPSPTLLSLHQPLDFNLALPIRAWKPRARMLPPARRHGPFLGESGQSSGVFPVNPSFPLRRLLSYVCLFH